MPLKREKRERIFRKKTLPVVFSYYWSEDNGCQFFTTTEWDELNLTQLYNQYRSRYHIPFSNEIWGIRQKYNGAAPRMAQLLGFGINVYRQYEQGEVTNHSNARLIHLAREPEAFLEFVRLSDLKGKPKAKLMRPVEKLIQEVRQESGKAAFIQRLTYSPDWE